MKQKYSEKELKTKTRAQLMELVTLEGIDIGDSPTNASICKQLLAVEVEPEVEETPAVEASVEETPVEETPTVEIPAEEPIAEPEAEETPAVAPGVVSRVIAQRRAKARLGVKKESSVQAAIAARRASAGVGSGSSVKEAIAARRALSEEKGF